MSLSTASGRFVIHLPFPGNTTELPSLISSDGLWSWTIKLLVKLVQPQDPEIPREYRLSVFCKVADQNDPSSNRAVTCGGTISFDCIGTDTNEVGLIKGTRFLKEEYSMKTITFRQYSDEYEYDVCCSFYVTEPMPEVSASGAARLSKSLGSLFNSGFMSDVKLCTEGHEIAAHRIILATRVGIYNFNVHS